MREKYMLIDGYSILSRAFYGVPALTAADGTPTNGVYGFFNILFKLMEEERPDYLTVAFDVKAPTFRHKMYADYKGTRKPMPQELLQQVPILKDVLKAMDIPTAEMAGYEADDILGTLSVRAQEAGMEVRLVSGDRDMLQLADTHVEILLPKTKRGGTVVEHYFPEQVMEAYGVTPREFIDVKALMGDVSDNIPGVPGIGEKTASALIQEYHSIEAVYENRDKVRPPRASAAMSDHYDLAVLSKDLARICTEVPIDFRPEEARLGNIYTREALLLFKKLELKSFYGRFDAAALDQQAPAGPSFRRETVSGLTEVQDVIRDAEKAAVRGLSLAVCGGELTGAALAFGDRSVYLPIEGFVTERYLTGLLEELTAAPGDTCVFGLKEQLAFLDPREEDRPRLQDIRIMAYLVSPLSGDYSYDRVSKDEAGILLPSPEELWGKKKPEEVFAAEPETYARRFLTEAEAALLCYEPLSEKLRELGMEKLYREMERPLIYVLSQMEKTGVRADRAALEEISAELGSHVEQLEKEIYSLSGETFNINSPKQLGEVLFEKLKLPYGKKTKSGYSTAADILEKLAPEHEVVGKILEYRTYSKLKSTYADGLQAFIREDGRIHGRFHQTVTATGRLSSSDPNLQNIPVRIELGRRLRKVFVPADGCVFLDADYSQIELRVLAHMSGDESLIRAYNEAQDIHAVTASQVFHVPLSEVTPALRRSAKAVNFGIVYGISAFGLSEDLSISRKEAAEYIERYFRTYPGIKAFLDGLVESARETGAAFTLYGRRRPVPELSSGNFMQRSFGERVAMNSPIQGTAADIMKIAMLRVDKALREKKMKTRIVLQVHDELILEAPEEEKEEAARLLQREMTGAADLKVRLEADVSAGKNWYETK